jgi:hypothetical protein
MASARLPVNRALNLGSAISDMAAKGEVFRQAVASMQSLTTAAAGYASDTTALATDTGLTTAQVTTFLNLLAAANLELLGATNTSTRQMLDAISFGR